MPAIEDKKKRWVFYQKHHWVSPDFSLTPILDSWERCSKRCNPYDWSKPHIASGYTLRSLLSRSDTLITSAITVVEDTYDSMQNMQVVLLVTDDNGCILLSLGNKELSEELGQLRIKDGSFLNEGVIGTNAVSVVLETHIASEVIGADHFNQHLHNYSMSAAPIFDTFGRIRGTFSVLTKVEAHSELINVIVSSCSREIASQLHINMEQEQSNKMSCTYNATLECMDDGLVAWNKDHHILKTNRQAEEILNIRAISVLDCDVFNIINFPPSLRESILNHEFIRRKQTTVEVNDSFIEVIVTIRPLSDGGSLLFIHPIDKIRELAQQQVGSSARYTFSNLISESKKMKNTIRLAKRAVNSRSPILISGEEGVGKSDLAMAMHNESPNRNGPFITMNCRTLNSEHAIQEILGHDDEGSGGQPSKFELAHGGTLFLEKIEQLDPELQGNLLKLLKTGLVSRYNSQRLIPVKFQLICSTYSDVFEYVTQGAFGKQLYYEISANEIEISPLRKRKEDIEYAVLSLINAYKKRHNVGVSINRAALDALINFRWNGNNSELKNKMERILLNRKGDLISMSDIPEDIKQNNTIDDVKQEVEVLSLEEIEKDAILHAWKIHNGKVIKIAKVLKVSRATLWRKMKKYGLDSSLS
ncbi:MULTISPECIES: dihydroxyacetone kinase operon transcriptional regulator DhaR [Vibrio]|uniref:PTS-dependent dihydroxyacetone kinase operon transcriptional regulator DhaR n=1 Tax=Vibrio mediterranei TaxID=689 RepID=A0ABX5DC30_9VIBR|nr:MULTISPECIES: dihydroxyacetone kinase operon transcriptional regulator DhaR [Vibrio]MCF4175377.1 PTS-dependent dihydroxyacetone kinase operon transcriptional regulator DhaR [Vibrio sp. McD22-P3]PCD85688.1 PTS-dependent dihydroxyacetone kinase operon transcriptional regulator DhaR [Vibrio mediterranei]PRQ67035.1 PTS-dependent dihydroxyacetone kinase operon transcriptional regulator DhaR [Vibrio mediterranei]SBO09875.1 Acetoin dehydrogenase operon transcriptional activator AcoR [Vibrio mediter